MQAAAPELVWGVAGGSYLHQGRGEGCNEGGWSNLASVGCSCYLFASAGLEPGCASVPGEVTGLVALLVDSVQGLFALGCVSSLLLTFLLAKYVWSKWHSKWSGAISLLCAGGWHLPGLLKLAPEALGPAGKVVMDARTDLH